MIPTETVCTALSRTRELCVTQSDSVGNWLVPLIAAVVGAGIGAFAIWLVHRADSRARAADRELQRRSRFEAALARTMEAMHERAASIPSEIAATHGQVPRGSAREAIARLQIARMLANDDEDRVLRALAALLESTIGTRDQERANLTAWASELLLWRRNEITSEKATEDFSAAWTEHFIVMFVERLVEIADQQDMTSVADLDFPGQGDVMGHLGIRETVYERAQAVLDGRQRAK